MISNHPLGAQNSLFCSFLATSLPGLPTTVSDIGRFRALALKDHFHRLSFLVFLIIRLIAPLLLFSHWFLISGLPFDVLFKCSKRKLCHYLFNFQLSFSHAPNSLCLCLCLLHKENLLHLEDWYPFLCH